MLSFHGHRVIRIETDLLTRGMVLLAEIRAKNSMALSLLEGNHTGE
jgi:hypothetical protein